MASLLKIDVSPRGDASYSRQIGSTFLNAWQAANPGAAVTTRDLAKQQPTYIDVQWIARSLHTAGHSTPKSTRQRSSFRTRSSPKCRRQRPS